MKNKTATIIMVLIFVIGVSLLLYPSISDYWNSFHQSKAIARYADVVDNSSEEERERIWNEALAYNEEMKSHPTVFEISDEQRAKYESCLNIGGDGMMGYLEIPSINCNLALYHGTDESVLQEAVGHLDWTFLPVGGEGTHCVVSGHRGLPSAKLLSNLDQMREGDIFILRILDEVLTYEVDQILIVEPSSMNALLPEEGQDYCTMVTCTPYGINTHRLLVRGHRIENPDESSVVRVTADASVVRPVVVAPVIGVPVLIILLILVSLSDRARRTEEQRENRIKQMMKK